MQECRRGSGRGSGGEWETGDNRREEPGSVALTVEETEACTVIPLRTTMAHGAGGNTGATEAKVGGMDNGNAHASIDETTHLGIRLACFLSHES